MSTLYSFPPIANPDASLLILGSMPGKASLAAHQYYAHPRNAFWKIMAALYRFSADAAYAERVHALQASGVALWDVLHSCERATSLDSDIVEESIVANDFTHFLKQHPNIKKIAFNGAKAEAAFKKYVLPAFSESADLHFFRLPSTSPAHAALTFDNKLSEWRKILLHTA